MQIGDYVIVFNTFEGIISYMNGNEVEVYCPDNNDDEPYLITTLDNVKLSEAQEKYNNGLLN